MLLSYSKLNSACPIKRRILVQTRNFLGVDGEWQGQKRRVSALSQGYIPNIQSVGYSSLNSVEISSLDKHQGAGILL